MPATANSQALATIMPDNGSVKNVGQMNQSRPLIVILFLMICGLNGLAQTNVVSVDMFGFLRGRKGISYERSFAKKFSVRLSYENQRYSYGERNGQTVYEVRGQGVIPELRFYPFNGKKPVPLGFYFGTSFRYIGVTETYSPADIELSGTTFNYTIISGYKFNYDRLVFDLLADDGSMLAVQSSYTGNNKIFEVSQEGYDGFLYLRSGSGAVNAKLSGYYNVPTYFMTNVGIGTTNPDSKLTVAGNIHSREVKVTIDAGSDFVFFDEYDLRTLPEIEEFIKANRHLPEIQSAKEMEKKD